MSEEGYVEERSVSGALLATIVISLLAALGGLVWCYSLQKNLGVAQAKLVAADQRNADLNQKLEATNARLRATSETLGQSVGMTQKQLELKAQSIMAQQKAAQAKLEEAQAATQKQIGAVSSQVSDVKTDVAATKTDLESTKAQLTRVIGDAGVMSGLIAKNHDELEILKHKGDRNYYEFTLQKGAQPTLLSTVKLQLKKADTKHSRYTLNVSADDKIIEKKDKGLNEPVQFYTGKDPALFELVVNTIDKNKVTGYLSTPKNVSRTASP